MRSTSLLYKLLPTNLVVCKAAFYTFYTSHLRYYEALFFYYTEKRMFSHANRPRAECSLKVFTIFQDQLHSQLIFMTIEARASFAQQIIKLTTL